MSGPDEGTCRAGPKQAAAAGDKEAIAQGSRTSGKHQSQASPYQLPSSQGWLLFGGTVGSCPVSQVWGLEAAL